ncbi:MAG TPA: GNAT family N-acetyltransferase [Erysipelothrix sp.]
MEYIELFMKSNDLSNTEIYRLPRGYHFTYYLKGYETYWADIESSVGEFSSKEKALKHFHEEFKDQTQALTKRCLFLVDQDRQFIGTTMAWFNDEGVGRLHWVAIKPEFQGQDLGKALVSKAVDVLGKYHQEAYLTTQTTSYKAINLYLELGFKPDIKTSECRRGWKLVEEKLGKRIII